MLVRRLREVLRGEGELLLSPSALLQHSVDESGRKGVPPLAVCLPRTTEQVSQVVRACAEHGTSVIPFGTGTGLEGGVCAVREAVCISTANMVQICSTNPDDFDATVQAGVTRKSLNHELRASGLMFPIDPGADASLGGMAATSASGTNAVRYGTMRENVVGLEVVLADGKVVRTSGTSRAKKSAAGYNLTNLFVGSEGTLGVITEVTLRIHPIPQFVSVAISNFPTVRDAIETVIDLRKSGVPIARVEFLDDEMVKAVNKYSGTSYHAHPGNLFFEFHGASATEVSEQVDVVSSLAHDHGSLSWDWATEPEDRARLWQARHSAYYAAKSLRHNARVTTTDVCVPISRLAEVISETKEDILKSPILAPLVGHVGDGNFHTLMVYDENNPEELRHRDFLYQRMIERAIRAEGTCTGEHGVGLGKKGFLARQVGPEGLHTLRLVKRALDPHNIMNPGKVFDLEGV